MYNVPILPIQLYLPTYVLHRSCMNNSMVILCIIIVDGSNDYYNIIIIIIITLPSLPQSTLFRHGPAGASQGEAVVGRTHNIWYTHNVHMSHGVPMRYYFSLLYRNQTGNYLILVYIIILNYRWFGNVINEKNINNNASKT